MTEARPSELRATIAIVRRHLDRRFGFDWLGQFALVALIAGVFAKTFTGPFYPAAIVAALSAAAAAERTHAMALRRTLFFAMPLYGRQLARAHAVAPLLLTTSIPLGYALGARLRGVPLAPPLFVAIVLCAIVATLVSISSIFRDGARAWLFGAGGAAAGFAVTLPVTLELKHGLPLAFASAAVAGYWALRAFGETLARYDPI